MGVTSVIASILSALLYISALVLFLVHVLKSRKQTEAAAVARQDFARNEYITVFIMCLSSLILHMAIASGIRLIKGMDTSVIGSLKLYGGLDSKHYFEIAKSGYAVVQESDEALNLVFFLDIHCLQACC